MLIAFDGGCLGDGPVTGVGRALLTGLQAYAARGEARCVLLLPKPAADPALPGIEIVEGPRGALRRQLQLPRLLRRLGADVLHSAVAAVPLRAACPTIATVHDLPWLHAELDEPATAWRRFATRRSLRAAAAVLAPSTATADDVRRIEPATKHLYIVPHGTPLGPAPTAADVQQRRGPLLVLGDDRPRKNRDRLRAAHRLAQLQAADLPALHFAGPPHDYVDEATKRTLLRDCRALVHISRFEGFGLPVLEGLAHGAPVVCSDLPPHREIAGECAVFVDALDIAAIAAGLVRVHADAELRLQLAHGGHARAATFSPAAVAAAWARVHYEVTS